MAISPSYFIILLFNHFIYFIMCSHRWTKEETDLLERQVESFPHKKNYCFLIVAECTSRSVASVRQKYYKDLYKKSFNTTKLSHKEKISYFLKGIYFKLFHRV
jgi:hypothetical protein|nr:MAG TPA: DNA methyltransferase 1-associated protein [Crassvirales sp.]